MTAQIIHTACIVWAKQQITANCEWWVTTETAMPCRSIQSAWTKAA